MLKRLRADQDTGEIPVIMVTARGTEHDIAASFRLGAVFHVEKPYETKDLLQKIQVALTLKETS
jgi:CheY-like chemotaxis protein